MGASLLAFGRMILVLGLIIAVMLVFARFVQKRQLGSGTRGGAKPFGQIEVLSRKALGQHVSLLVVRVARRTFLVGQSSQQMTLLAELEGDEWVDKGTPNATSGVSRNGYKFAPGTALDPREDSLGAWDALIDRLREMTVRR